MESLPQKVSSHRLLRARCSRGAALGMLGVLMTTTGCVGLGPFALPSDPPPTGKVCQIVTTWNREVEFPPDPTHGGAPTPGISGRLYLFGPEINFPLVGDGSITVDLYNDAPKTPDGKPVLLEEWRIDKETLRRLLRKDMIGWGYTLFLPWGTYKPEITQVHLIVRYEPLAGVPLYAPISPLTLENPSNESNHTTCKMSSSQQVVKSASPPAKPNGQP